MISTDCWNEPFRVGHRVAILFDHQFVQGMIADSAIELEEFRVSIDDRRIDQPLAVAREYGRAIEELVVGDIGNRAAFDVVGVNVGNVAFECSERDRLPVWRVRR